ncbi:uncharacterized protein LOC141854941 isoform X2 [Brevipalpus obovatus]|uniref:uncharacterized protein LOC141854941 isoform X2 n=1 Tax=Brevipalpus obovatus TaxID=246614 RepID=UPI003D9E434C
MVKVEPGDIIIECYPIVHKINLKEKMRRCNYCFIESSSLRKCSACKFIWYCSVDCQANDWKYIHRAECKFRPIGADPSVDYHDMEMNFRFFRPIYLSNFRPCSRCTPDRENKRLLMDLSKHFNEALSTGDNSGALTKGLELLECERNISPSPNPYRTILLKKLVELSIKLEDDWCIALEKDLRDNFLITHGREHFFYKEVEKLSYLTTIFIMEA